MTSVSFHLLCLEIMNKPSHTHEVAGDELFEMNILYINILPITIGNPVRTTRQIWRMFSIVLTLAPEGACFMLLFIYAYFALFLGIFWIEAFSELIPYKIVFHCNSRFQDYKNLVMESAGDPVLLLSGINMGLNSERTCIYKQSRRNWRHSE